MSLLAPRRNYKSLSPGIRFVQPLPRESHPLLALAFPRAALPNWGIVFDEFAHNERRLDYLMRTAASSESRQRVKSPEFTGIGIAGHLTN